MCSLCGFVHSIWSKTSSSDGTPVTGLILEFFEGHPTISVLIVLAQERLGLPESNEEAPGLQHLLHLTCRDGATVIQIQAVEGLEGVEGRVGVETLPEGLGTVLDSDVGAPHGLDLGCCVRQEDVKPVHHARNVVGSSSAQHGGVVGVERQEGLLELGEGESAISGLVVSGDEELALVEGRIDADGVQPHLELGDRDGAGPVEVEDVEGIVDVEVLLLRKEHFVVLKLLLQYALLSQGVDQVVLVWNSQDRLARGRDTWRRPSTRWRLWEGRHRPISCRRAGSSHWIERGLVSNILAWRHYLLHGEDPWW